jgi:transcriptional regulator with XRE-family HTH domain
MGKRIRKAAVDESNIPKRRVRKPVSHRLRTQELNKPNGKDTSKRARNVVEEELFKAGLAEGLTREQIATVLGLTTAQLAPIEKRVLANDGQRFLTKATAYRYYEYYLRQEQCIRDLEYFVQMIYNDAEKYAVAYKNACDGKLDEDYKLPPKPSVQAAVMAIKAKSDIHDKTIRMGQELGIIEKRAKEIRVSGNINLAALPTEQLRLMLDKKLKQMDALVSRGEVPSVFDNILRSRNAGRLPPRSDEPEQYLDSEHVQEDSRSVE